MIAMRFVRVNGKWQELNEVTIGFSGNNVALVKTNATSSFYIIDLNDLKHTLKYIAREWFGFGKGLVFREGIFWTAFLTYIFPWFMDIAKVYCAIMICQAFYKERQGGTGADGRTGMQALVYYGKWFIVFNLIPWLVELIDQVGGKMYQELRTQGLSTTN